MDKESKAAEMETDVLTKILLEESETFELFYKPSYFNVVELDASEENSTTTKEPQVAVAPVQCKPASDKVFKKDKSAQTLRSQSIMVVKHKFTNTTG